MWYIIFFFFTLYDIWTYFLRNICWLREASANTFPRPGVFELDWVLDGNVFVGGVFIATLVGSQSIEIGVFLLICPVREPLSAPNSVSGFWHDEVLTKIRNVLVRSCIHVALTLLSRVTAGVLTHRRRGGWGISSKFLPPRRWRIKHLLNVCIYCFLATVRLQGSMVRVCTSLTRSGKRLAVVVDRRRLLHQTPKAWVSLDEGARRPEKRSRHKRQLRRCSYSLQHVGLRFSPHTPAFRTRVRCVVASTSRPRRRARSRTFLIL